MQIFTDKAVSELIHDLAKLDAELAALRDIADAARRVRDDRGVTVCDRCHTCGSVLYQLSDGGQWCNLCADEVHYHCLSALADALNAYDTLRDD